MREKTNHQVDACQICKEISGELKDLVGWLSGGELGPAQFAATVMTMEKRKLFRHGLKLSSAISREHIVHFSLRFADTDELCASMDVHPKTGKIEVQLACA
jgi:hypothetical protein